MVVVLAALAASVEHLLVAAHLVHLTGLGQRGEVAVDGGQPHLGPLRLQGGVDLLGGAELLGALQDVAHGGALPG